MPVLQLTPERVDHHHRQLGTPDPSSQYFLLHKPSQCSFPPAMFLSYQTYMFNLIKNPYILSTKNILKLLYIKKIYSAWLNEENYLFNIFFPIFITNGSNPSKKLLVTSCYKKQRTLYLISVLLSYRVLCFEHMLLISLIKQLLLEFWNHF